MMDGRDEVAGWDMVGTPEASGEDLRMVRDKASEMR
jgi:hypothetical protein